MQWNEANWLPRLLRVAAPMHDTFTQCIQGDGQWDLSNPTLVRIRKVRWIRKLKCIVKHSFVYRDYVGSDNSGLYRFHC